MKNEEDYCVFLIFCMKKYLFLIETRLEIERKSHQNITDCKTELPRKEELFNVFSHLV